MWTSADVTMSKLVGDIDKFFSSGASNFLYNPAAVDPSSILTLDEIDEIITGRALRTDSVRVSKNNVYVDKRQFTRKQTGGASAELLNIVDPVALTNLFALGNTILLRWASTYAPKVNQLCKSLEEVYDRAVGADLFITPPDSQGFDAHADQEHGFIIQLSGVKRWEIFPQRTATNDAPATVLDMQPGDVLYVPSQMQHRVQALSSASVHLTVSVAPIAWVDLVISAIRIVARDQLKGSVPEGRAVSQQVGDELQKRMLSLMPALTEPSTIKAAIRATPGFGDSVHGGTFKMAISGLKVEPTTELKLVAGAKPIVVDAHLDVVGLFINGRSMRVPRQVGQACALFGAAPVSVRDLNPALDEAQRIASFLLKVGIVETQPK